MVESRCCTQCASTVMGDTRSSSCALGRRLRVGSGWEYTRNSAPRRFAARHCSVAASAALATVLLVAPGHAAHVLPVGVHEVRDPLGMLARMRAGVLHRTAEPHIVANEILAFRVGAQVVDVHLLYLVLPIEVASVVRLLAIGHLLCSG